MSGGPDPLYVRARDALLDAADALTEQLRRACRCSRCLSPHRRRRLRQIAMTHRIAEQDLKLGYYVIGVFDVLGQSRKLLRPMSFSPRTHVEERLVADKLRETVIAVDRFRDLFQRQFDERRKAFDQDASLVPEPQRTAFRAALASNIVSWGMSDAFCVAVPLEAGSGATGAMAAMADVRRLLEVAAATWLFSFAEGDPIRGGMEIGTAAKDARERRPTVRPS